MPSSTYEVMAASLLAVQGVRVQVPLGALEPHLREDKPTGAGSRLLNGRAQALRVRLPLLPPSVPLAERQRHRSSKPNRWVQLPQGTLGDRLKVGRQSLKLLMKV